MILALALTPAVAPVMVGCGGGWPAKGKVATARSGIDRRVLTEAEIAALLNDNPTALARREKERKEAIAEARAAANEGQGGGPVDDGAPEVDVLALMKQAQEAHEAGDWPRATKYAREVLEHDPKGYPYAHVILGDVHLAAKDYPAALERYQRAIELDDKDGWAVQRAAEALRKMGKVDAARSMLREFVGKHPDADADTWDALAWMELEAGDLSRAEAAFKGALAASNGQDAEAWYGLALIAARRRDPAATERALRALFDLQPERRIVLERDPTFFRMRIHPGVRALFSPERMAEAKVAAEKKKANEKTGGGGDAAAAAAALAGTKLSIPGGPETILAETVRFDYDSAKIRGESKVVLDEIANFLKAQGIEFVEITGHADRRGDEGYNVKLSELRARAVRDALVARGLPAAKLRVRGYGIYCPLDDGDGEEAFARNRRVQFAIGAGGKVLGEELTCTERLRRWLKPGSRVKLVATK